MKLKKAAALSVGVVAALSHLTRTAWAQDVAARGGARAQIGDPYGFVSTLLFGLLGIIIAVAGFKLFDLVIKADVEHEICENKNVAAAVLGAAVILGVSIIVAATILS